jgi:hypothetical protein
MMQGKRIFLPVCLVALWIILILPVYAGFGDFLEGAKKLLSDGEGVTESEIVQGLKEALHIGTGNAVAVVSKTDGYYKNPHIKILLPKAVKKAEKILRAVGYGPKVDAFELSMNRAAEKAAPQAKSIFWDSIKKMSFADAKKILQGRDNEATLYFKEKTFARLQDAFRPVVRDTMSETGVTRSYQELDAKVRTIPLAGKFSFDLDQYVTEKSLNGLFYMLAEEEKKIRENPQARVTDLLKKVFGNR